MGEILRKRLSFKSCFLMLLNAFEIVSCSVMGFGFCSAASCHTPFVFSIITTVNYSPYVSGSTACQIPDVKICSYIILSFLCAYIRVFGFFQSYSGFYKTLFRFLSTFFRFCDTCVLHYHQTLTYLFSRMENTAVELLFCHSTTKEDSCLN